MPLEQIYVQILSDIARLEDVVISLSSGHIVALDIVRPDFNKLSDDVCIVLPSVPVQQLEIQAPSGTWMKCIIPTDRYPEIADVSTAIFLAFQSWEEEGAPVPYTITIAA